MGRWSKLCQAVLYFLKNSVVQKKQRIKVIVARFTTDFPTRCIANQFLKIK
jgi:hypothetical protein